MRQDSALAMLKGGRVLIVCVVLRRAGATGTRASSESCCSSAEETAAAAAAGAEQRVAAAIVGRANTRQAVMQPFVACNIHPSCSAMHDSGVGLREGSGWLK